MIFRNTVAQTAAYVSGYVLSFILAPVMIARLGLPLFGVWAVTGAFATYAGLVDLGVTRSVERFVAFHHTRGENEAVAECLALGLLVATGVGVVGAAVALPAAPLLAGSLDHVLDTSDMRVVLLAAVGILVMNAYRAVLESVPIGMQQMVPPSLATIFYNVVSFAVSLAALLASQDLRVYALANVAAAAVGVGAAAVSVRFVWGSIPVRRPSRAVRREVLAYGVKTQVSWLAELVNAQTDKIIIAVVVGVRAAGAYELANRAVSAVRTVGMMSVSALLSAATATFARDGAAAIRDFYQRYALRSMAVSMPLMVLAAVAAPVLLKAWLGEIPEHALALFIGLTIANATNLCTGVVASVLLGEGRAGVLATFAVGTAGLNVLLTLALTPPLGLWGVVGATVVSMVASSLAGLWYFHRTHDVPLRDSVTAIATPTVVALGAALPLILWLLVVGAPAGERVPSAIASVAFGAVFVGLYWPAATALGILPERLALPSVRRRRPSVPA